VTRRIAVRTRPLGPVDPAAPSAGSAESRADRLWNPYVAGVALGLVLLASFLVLGHGLGASGATHRLGVAALETVAPERVAGNEYLAAVATEGSPLASPLVFLLAGAFLGALTAAFSAGRLRRAVLRGPRVGKTTRLALALTGGVMMGFAARLTLGCTSGQALSGGALLSLGSWLFMFSVFGGGYGAAWFVRRQWT
jgi:uncharacterized protein